MGSLRPSRPRRGRNGEAPVGREASRPAMPPRSRTRRRELWALALAPFLTGGSTLSAQLSWDACEAAGGAAESVVGQWRGLLGGRGSISSSEFAARAADLLDRTVALGVIAEEIFQGDWAQFSSSQRAEFLDVLRTSLRDGLVSFLDDEMRGTVPTFTATGGRDDRGTVEYSLEIPGGRAQELTLSLATVGSEACKVVDVEYRGDRLLKDYRDWVEDLVDDYSFPYMIAKLGNRDEMILDDFESSPLGQFPVGWAQREDDDEPPYRIREEGGNRYLEATDQGESVIIGLETPWNLDEYPYISFRLRVNRIPEGADERTDDRVDSAAGVYVTVKKVAFGKIPESVKYVWSATLPVGAATRREGIGRPWQVVLGSGTEGLGEWRTYVFDVRDAYRRTFGGNPGSKPAGVGVLSDANNMKTYAFADYDDFKVLRHAPAGTDGGVEQRLRPLRRN